MDEINIEVICKCREQQQKYLKRAASQVKSLVDDADWFNTHDPDKTEAEVAELKELIVSKAIKAAEDLGVFEEIGGKSNWDCDLDENDDPAKCMGYWYYFEEGRRDIL